MTSVRTTNSDLGDARSAGTRDGSARLSLKPKGSAREALDGVWWPRSTDPAIELTALNEAVGVPVRRIALNMAGWDNAPRRWRPDRHAHDRAVTTHPASSAADVALLSAHEPG